jgi:glutamate-5-semialdehyde dehydrogenase
MSAANDSSPTPEVASLDREMDALGARARAANRLLARSPGPVRNAALLAMADALGANKDALLAANALDLTAAEGRGISGAMLDRLRLTPTRLDDMAKSLREIAAQPDPIGEVLGLTVRPNGLKVGQMRIPLGVIGIVYEARPNVTTDAAGLCLKSGNAVFLRGGSEAQHSNGALIDVLRAAITAAGLPADAVMTLPSTDRAWILAMLRAERWIDLCIPRGGEALIHFVVENARVPVIKHYKGVCHVYVHAAADLKKAVDICYNAKVQRPGVCNALETLLVDANIAAEFLPLMAARLGAAGVEFRGDAETCALLPQAVPATEADWHAEYLDLILAVRVVPDVDAAIAHIETYGSDHTESIVSEDYSVVQRFLDEVQSSVVIANASTRFSDGGQLGLGAEIGISTTRLHSYGPMGALDLTTRKYVIYGSGQIRS